MQKSGRSRQRWLQKFPEIVIDYVRSAFAAANEKVTGSTRENIGCRTPIRSTGTFAVNGRFRHANSVVQTSAKGRLRVPANSGR